MFSQLSLAQLFSTYTEWAFWNCLAMKRGKSCKRKPKKKYQWNFAVGCGKENKTIRKCKKSKVRKMEQKVVRQEKRNAARFLSFEVYYKRRVANSILLYQPPITIFSLLRIDHRCERRRRSSDFQRPVKGWSGHKRWWRCWSGSWKRHRRGVSRLAVLRTRAV